MRKLTAIERNEQLRQAQEDSARLGSALQDILTDNIQATASVPEVPGRAVHLQAHARGEPCGGLVVVIFHYPGQRDSVTVYQAESLLRGETISRWPSACWPALDKLVIARNSAPLAA